MATTGFLYALAATWRRSVEAFSDPIRRLHIASQFLVLVPAATAAALQVALGWHWPGPWDTLACAAAGVTYFIVYEWILEPWSKARVKRGKPSLVGPYVERGPQDGERFVNE